MRFVCPLFVVKDIQISRAFYQEVLQQKIKFDFGENIVFEGDFALQEANHFAAMVQIPVQRIKTESHNAELYFEQDDMETFTEHLKTFDDIVHLHPLVEHSWGQRVLRFYDPDSHIVEVGESMETVIRRLASMGLSIDEVAAKTQHPYDFVKNCLAAAR